jgi:hypothetical protein
MVPEAARTRLRHHLSGRCCKYTYENQVDEQQRLFNQLVEEMRMLERKAQPEAGKSVNALVVKFDTAVAANWCIVTERIAFQGDPKRTQKSNCRYI